MTVSVCSQRKIKENHIADHLPVGNVELSAAPEPVTVAAANFFRFFPRPLLSKDAQSPQKLAFFPIHKLQKITAKETD